MGCYHRLNVYHTPSSIVQTWETRHVGKAVKVAQTQEQCDIVGSLRRRACWGGGVPGGATRLIEDWGGSGPRLVEEAEDTRSPRRWRAPGSPVTKEAADTMFAEEAVAPLPGLLRRRRTPGLLMRQYLHQKEDSRTNFRITNFRLSVLRQNKWTKPNLT